MAMTEQARIDAIENEVAAENAKGNAAHRVTIPEYRGGDGGLVPVIRLNVKYVLFNPESHRIRAQLAGHELREKIEREPFDDESQQAIEAILRASPKFPDIRDSIDDKGQQHYGIVTYRGVLINANRRLAALRSLGREFIEVAVLPKAADLEDLKRLETELQVQRDLKEDYTFPNQLLLTDDYMTTFQYDVAKTAEALNITPDEVERQVRMLQIVHDLMRNVSGGALKYEHFDDLKEALQHLEKQIEAYNKKGDIAGAERVRRRGYFLLAMQAGYESMRELCDEDPSDDTLIPFIEDIDICGPALVDQIEKGEQDVSAVNDDDSDLLGGGVVTAAGPDYRPLTRAITSSTGERDVPINDVLKVERAKLIPDLFAAIKDATEQKKMDRKTAKTRDDPSRFIREALDRVEKARNALIKAHANTGYDIKKFEADIKKLTRKATQLQHEFVDGASNDKNHS